MATTEHEIFFSFAKIIEEVTGIPAGTVTRDADMADELEISSLSMVEMLISAEDKFNIEIPDDALKDFKTVQDVVGYVQRAQQSVVGLSVPAGPAPEQPAT